MSPPKKTSIICVVQYNIEYLTKHSAKKKLETNDDNNISLDSFVGHIQI